MTSAIARWHSSARPPSDALEQAYADQLEAEMQEMAIQLHKVSAKLSLNLDTKGKDFFFVAYPNDHLHSCSRTFKNVFHLRICFSVIDASFLLQYQCKPLGYETSTLSITYKPFHLRL